MGSGEQAELDGPSGGPKVSGIRDGDLVLRARDGDGRAYDALYRRYARVVGGTAARLLGTRQEVDDVVHDVFVTAFEKLHDLREPQAFRSWLMRIAVMRVRQVLRRHRLRATLGLRYPTDDATLEALASSEVTPERRAELSRLDELLRELPGEQRVAWMLRHVEGYTTDEVASLCACSASTVKRRLRAAARRIDPVLRLDEWGCDRA